jgi:hypothetical protein
MHATDHFTRTEEAASWCSCGVLDSILVTCVLQTHKLLCPLFIVLPLDSSSHLGLEMISIKTCQCVSPALQHLQSGLFPCAPCRPTLAVSLELLELTPELFSNVAPNTMAWCQMIEAVLKGRKFRFGVRVSSTNCLSASLPDITSRSHCSAGLVMPYSGNRCSLIKCSILSKMWSTITTPMGLTELVMPIPHCPLMPHLVHILRQQRHFPQDETYLDGPS